MIRVFRCEEARVTNCGNGPGADSDTVGAPASRVVDNCAVSAVVSGSEPLAALNACRSTEYDLVNIVRQY